MRLLNNLADRIISFLYPKRCLGCDKIISRKYFCKACEENIKYITVKTCSDCGLPMKHCACKHNFYYFDEMISCFEGNEETKQAFYSFKFRGNYLGGRFFAKEMAKRVKQSPSFENFDIVTSVPSHKSTVREREYDQVAVLAKHIAKEIKIKYKPILRQPKRSVKQHESVGIDKRFENVKSKYSLIKRSNIKDKTVLLVDDIKTTGATLSQCARELKLAGAHRVCVVTALTIYPKPKEENKSSQKTADIF